MGRYTGEVKTNLNLPTYNLNDKLIQEARKLGGHQTKIAAINAALEHYNRHLRRLEVIQAFGTIDFDPAYDYKAERKSKRI